MEHFWDKLADLVISQFGAFGLIAVGIILYLGWQLAKERERNERDREQAKHESENREKAFDAQADALRAIAVTLAEMKGLLLSLSRN